MKKIDTLIISGASITASPWFTWADIAIKILQPRRVINLSARGVGNYYIVLSCLNALTQNNSESVLCMPMFTTIDKFDMYIPAEKISQYLGQKHKPWQLTAQPAQKNTSGFWSTGSHWPDVKELYYNNFFNESIATINNLLLFYNLDSYCSQNQIDLVPLFDSSIWNLLESDLNAYVKGIPIPNRNLLKDELVVNFTKLLSPQWLEFTPLINYAIDNQLPFYNEINKMHPPSNVHLSWFKDTVSPQIEKQFDCSELDTSFLNKLTTFSKEW